MSMTRSAIAANGSDLQDDFVMAIAVGYVSVQNIDPKQCFSGKTPRGDAEGTTGGGTSTTDAREGTAAAPSAPSALSVPGTVCTAVPAKTASTATGSGASATANTTVISRGHVDVGSRIVNGKVRTLVKDGSQGGVVWREPGATTLWLKPASKVSSREGSSRSSELTESRRGRSADAETRISSGSAGTPKSSRRRKLPGRCNGDSTPSTAQAG